jgi:hypothetical protein
MLLSLNGDFANIVTIRLKTTKELSRFRCATFGNFLICLRDCRLTCICGGKLLGVEGDRIHNRE